jgi:hypothetical protein
MGEVAESLPLNDIEHPRFRITRVFLSVHTPLTRSTGNIHWHRLATAVASSSTILMQPLK